MKYCKHATFAALSMLVSSAVAAQSLSYNYLQLGYSAGEYDDLEVFNLGGFEVEGSYEINDNFFVSGKYRDADDSAQGFTFDEAYWQACIGYRFNFRADIVFDTRIYYNQVDFDLHGSEEYLSADANFFSLAGNARYQALEDMEVYGGVEWQRGQKAAIKPASGVVCNMPLVNPTNLQWGQNTVTSLIHSGVSCLPVMLFNPMTASLRVSALIQADIADNNISCGCFVQPAG